MSKKNDTGTAKLDLGLEALLARSESATAKEATSDSLEVEETSIVTLNERDGGFSEEFTSLARAKQWGILVGRTETALATEDDIEARLWWIRAHLGAFSLPVSLLAAPFETLCRQLHSNSDATEVFKPLVSEIGEMMVERLRGVGDRRQEISVSAALGRLCLEQLEDRTPIAAEAVPSRAPRFELGIPKQGEVQQKEEPLQRRRTRKRYAPWFVLLVLLGLLGIGVAGHYYFVSPTVIAVSEGLLPEQSLPGLVSPIVEARAVHGDLGALYYSLADGMPAAPGVNERPASPESNSANLQGGSKGAAEKVPPAEKPAAKSKESINTDGPLEDSEFRRGVERGQQSAQARLPALGYDPQPRPVPSLTMPEIGGAVLGQIKSVIVDTNVTDSPSYQARIIARLREGDKVSVEAHSGRWVRIRSQRGKTGYVFAQDIGELEDFSLPDASGQ